MTHNLKKYFSVYPNLTWSIPSQTTRVIIILITISTMTQSTIERSVHEEYIVGMYYRFIVYYRFIIILTSKLSKTNH